MKIAAVCGSFHKKEIEAMLEYAIDEAEEALYRNLRGSMGSRIYGSSSSIESCHCKL